MCSLILILIQGGQLHLASTINRELSCWVLHTTPYILIFLSALSPSPKHKSVVVFPASEESVVVEGNYLFKISQVFV